MMFEGWIVLQTTEKNMQVNGWNVGGATPWKTNFGQATVQRDPKNGQVNINAGSGNDNIYVNNLGNNKYGVNVNGQNFTFDRSELANGLNINGGRGNDNIILGKGVD